MDRRTSAVIGVVILTWATASATVASASQAERASPISVERDLSYAPGLALDIHRPTGVPTPLPAVVTIHGGAFTEGLDRSVMSDVASEIAATGYVVANLDYRLLVPEGGVNRWPAQLEDAQAAIRWLRENAPRLGVAPERICAVGHSSGGQLAALLGLRDSADPGEEVSSRVSCVVSLAGVTDPAAFFSDDFVPGPFDPRPPTLDLLAGSPDDAPATYADASPLAWVDPAAAPFLIIHGHADEMLPVSQSRRLAEALQGAGVEVIYAELPGSNHFETLTWDVTGALIVAFLQRHLGTGG